MRIDYEEVVIKEMTETAQNKINELKKQLAEKNGKYEETIHFLEEELRRHKSRVEELENKIKEL